jgi:aspartyl-tRNA(Asn)/glutamyl-tRNA(Gln) amidotransferase subunit C
MTLTKEEVRKIAELARIELSEAEIEKFQKDLIVVLDYVSELSKVDTEGVLEIDQVTGLENVLRPDIAKLSDLSAAIVKNFPESKEGYLKIKSIL